MLFDRFGELFSFFLSHSSDEAHAETNPGGFFLPALRGECILGSATEGGRGVFHRTIPPTVIHIDR